MLNVACNEVLNYTPQQWRGWVFKRLGRAVTMAAPDTNCEFKKITFQFPLISLHNLKTAERRKSNFVV